MRSLLKRFIRDETGATAIEYGLIGVLVSIAIIAGATSLGSALGSKFNTVASKVTNATN